MNSDTPTARITLLGVVALGLFGALFARLWFLQVLTEQEFQLQATANSVRTVFEPAPRGRILDSQGRVLVGNREVNVVVMDGLVLTEGFSDTDRAAFSLRLATELSATGSLTKAAEIAERLDVAEVRPFDEIVLATDVDELLTVFLAERPEQFPGVSLVRRTVREYPYGSTAAHVLGYVGPITEEEYLARADRDGGYRLDDEIGKAGVEAAFEEFLRGTPGQRRIEVDARGDVIREVAEAYVPPRPGNDVVLSIDIDLQALVEDELASTLAARRLEQDQSYEIGFRTLAAPAGAAVVLDPSNGDILAMASYPTFDPAEFVGGISQDAFDELNDPDNDFPLNNRAIQGTYAAASTFKLITSYAAIDTGLLGPRGFLDVNQFTPDPGFYTLDSCQGEESQCTFTNAGEAPSGDVDLRLALAVSSDVYYYRLAEQFSIRSGYQDEDIAEAARAFGYGARTGVALPFESPGLILDPESFEQRSLENPDAFPRSQWLTGDTINLSIGQGDVRVTPLQLVNSYAALANGGTLYSPNIAVAVVDPLSSEEVRSYGPRVLGELWMPDEIRDPIVEGLVGAVQFNEGTGAFRKGTAFDVFEGFPFASFSVAGKTGTAEVPPLADFSLFAAFGPVEDARYAMAVVMEESGFGSEAAAPMTRNVFEAIATDSIPEALTLAERARLRAEALAAANAPDQPDAAAAEGSS
ncbi:MAG: penicillin-binding protein 2 [Acidimicrobiales bacterium]